jgi:hypothetical protein
LNVYFGFFHQNGKRLPLRLRPLPDKHRKFLRAR